MADAGVKVRGMLCGGGIPRNPWPGPGEGAEVTVCVDAGRGGAVLTA